MLGDAVGGTDRAGVELRAVVVGGMDRVGVELGAITDDETTGNTVRWERIIDNNMTQTITKHL